MRSHGAPNGGQRLYLTIDEYSRFGRMLLGRGVLQRRSRRRRAYLDAARVQTTLPGSKDGYGYQFWINPGREGYRADGKYGQFIIVLRKRTRWFPSCPWKDAKTCFPPYGRKSFPSCNRAIQRCFYAQSRREYQHSVFPAAFKILASPYRLRQIYTCARWP